MSGTNGTAAYPVSSLSAHLDVLFSEFPSGGKSVAVVFYRWAEQVEEATLDAGQVGNQNLGGAFTMGERVALDGLEQVEDASSGRPPAGAAFRYSGATSKSLFNWENRFSLVGCRLEVFRNSNSERSVTLVIKGKTPSLLTSSAALLSCRQRVRDDCSLSRNAASSFRARSIRTLRAMASCSAFGGTVTNGHAQNQRRHVGGEQLIQCPAYAIVVEQCGFALGQSQQIGSVSDCPLAKTVDRLAGKEQVPQQNQQCFRRRELRAAVFLRQSVSEEFLQRRAPKTKWTLPRHAMESIIVRKKKIKLRDGALDSRRGKILPGRPALEIRRKSHRDVRKVRLIAAEVRVLLFFLHSKTAASDWAYNCTH